MSSASLLGRASHPPGVRSSPGRRAAQAARHRGRADRRPALRRDRLPLREAAEYPAAGSRGCALRQRLRDVAALLAEPGEPADRAVRAQARHRRQHRPQPAQPRARDLPAPAPRPGLRDGVRRQVAHGRRRLAAAGLRPLGEHRGPGPLPRPGVQRRRQARGARRLLHRPAQRVRGRVPEARAPPAVPALRLAQGRPPRPDPERGRQRVGRGGRQLRPGAAARAALRGGRDPPSPQPRPAAHGQARPAPVDRRPAAARAFDGDERRDRPQAAARARRRGRGARPDPERARGARDARRHARRLHERRGLLLRRARPERRAAARVRGVRPRPVAGALPPARPDGEGRRAADDRPRPRADAAAGRGRADPARICTGARSCRCSAASTCRGATRS